MLLLNTASYFLQAVLAEERLEMRSRSFAKPLEKKPTRVSSGGGGKVPSCAYRKPALPKDALGQVQPDTRARTGGSSSKVRHI